MGSQNVWYEEDDERNLPERNENPFKLQLRFPGKRDFDTNLSFVLNLSDFSAYDNGVGDDGIKVDSVLGRLHEIVRLMCMVWAKQGLANRLVSGGEKNGGLSSFQFLCATLLGNCYCSPFR